MFPINVSNDILVSVNRFCSSHEASFFSRRTINAKNALKNRWDSRFSKQFFRNAFWLENWPFCSLCLFPDASRDVRKTYWFLLSQILKFTSHPSWRLVFFYPSQPIVFWKGFLVINFSFFLPESEKWLTDTAEKDSWFWFCCTLKFKIVQN